eukprot:4155784-Pyramimonas_sp.AAC.1
MPPLLLLLYAISTAAAARADASATITSTTSSSRMVSGAPSRALFEYVQQHAYHCQWHCYFLCLCHYRCLYIPHPHTTTGTAVGLGSSHIAHLPLLPL